MPIDRTIRYIRAPNITSKLYNTQKDQAIDGSKDKLHMFPFIGRNLHKYPSYTNFL